MGPGGRSAGNSLLLTAGIIVADVVGVGILSIPSAVASFGWLLGSGMMVLMMAMNLHVSILIWRICMYYGGIQTTQELAVSVFSSAAAWQLSAITAIATASQQCFIFCMLGLYTLSFGENLGTTFYSARLCVPIWMLLGGALLLPFAGTSRRMGGWPSLLYINVLTLLAVIFIPLAYMAYVGADEMRPADSQVRAVGPLTVGGCLEALSATTFAFAGQFILPEIIAEMRDPAKFPQAYGLVATPFMLSAFLLVGVGTYKYVGNKYCEVGTYKYVGDQTCGMVLDVLPFGTPLAVAACCLMLHMQISYLIKSSVFCNFILSMVESACGGSGSAGEKAPQSWMLWNLMVLLVLAAAWTFANVVPFFADLVSLLGASLTPLSCYVLPILMFARWYKDSGHAVSRVSRWEWLFILFELWLALVLMVSGTVQAVAQILEHWHTYGPPFQCHCEDIWDTCKCSAGRPGMAEVCPANLTPADTGR